MAVNTVWLLEYYECSDYEGCSQHTYGIYNSKEAAQQALDSIEGNEKWKNDCLHITEYTVNHFHERF